MGNTSPSCIYVPSQYRKSLRMIKELYRLSKEAWRILEKEDEDLLLSFNSVINDNDNHCIHLVRSMMKMGNNVV